MMMRWNGMGMRLRWDGRDGRGGEVVGGEGRGRKCGGGGVDFGERNLNSGKFTTQIPPAQIPPAQIPPAHMPPAHMPPPQNTALPNLLPQNSNITDVNPIAAKLTFTHLPLFRRKNHMEETIPPKNPRPKNPPPLPTGSNITSSDPQIPPP